VVLPVQRPPALRLRQLYDVAGDAPSDGLLLRFDALRGRWVPAPATAAGLADGAVTYAKLAADVPATLDGRYVNVAGDTMTGPLTATALTALVVDATSAGINTGTLPPGTSLADRLTLIDDTNAGFRYYQFNAVDGANLRGVRGRGTPAAPTRALANDVLAKLSGFAWYDNGAGSAGVSSLVGSLQFITAEDATDGTPAGYFTLLTSDGSTAAERLRVDKDGLVGIGLGGGAAGSQLHSTTTSLARSAGRFQGAVSQSAPVLEVVNSSGGGLFAIGPGGAIRTANRENTTANAWGAAPAAGNRRLPIYDEGGTLWGYIPIYT